MVCSSNITSGFIDLATYDELERYLYGGESATAYFVREVRKSTWFTQVPVCLSNVNGTPGFGQDFAVSISRAGDYLVHAWLRVNLPAVGKSSAEPFGAGINWQIRWTNNLMHNLVKECTVTFNDLMAARFDNYHLDFWAAFTVPAGKNLGYQNMIGNVAPLTLPSDSLPAATLNLPLPFWFCRDSGVALPTAALPYNEMRINYQFRNWNELLIASRADPAPTALAGRLGQNLPVEAAWLSATPVLGQVQTWANYAIVSNDERVKMGCAPRNILIEQVQTAPLQNYAPLTNNSPSFDLRFSHAIKVMFFAVRNTTCSSLWSNYTSASPVPTQGSVDDAPSGAVDPVNNTTLTYENTTRLNQMGSDYYSLVQPWYHAPVIPQYTGYHMYSYSLDFICLDPKGSTNYGKLTNVSISPLASAGAVAGATGGQTGSVADYNSGLYNPQLYRFVTTVVNNNIIRISGGALGFPVL